MLTIKLAGHVFAIENHYTYVEKLCRDYLTEEIAEHIIHVTEDEILAENQTGERWSYSYLESLAVYRKITEYLLTDDILLFHCSAFSIDGTAYLFTAPSGTGKSTHARLWRQYFGNRVITVNDDKPLLAVRKDGIIVYGTPYGGKENLQNNVSAKVGGIVVLHQAPENEIRRLSAKEAYPVLLNQTYRCEQPQGLLHTMDLVGLLSGLPVFSLGCTISTEAVELAWSALQSATRSEPEKEGKEYSNQENR